MPSLWPWRPDPTPAMQGTVPWRQCGHWAHLEGGCSGQTWRECPGREAPLSTEGLTAKVMIRSRGHGDKWRERFCPGPGHPGWHRVLDPRLPRSRPLRGPGGCLLGHPLPRRLGSAAPSSPKDVPPSCYCMDSGQGWGVLGAVTEG